MTPDQTTLRRAILDPDLPVPDGLLDGQGAPAGKRFAVYRNNVVVSLTEALATGFPVIAKLIGTQNFNAVMGEFLRRYPPRSPLMMHYGADLPAFLADFRPLAHLGYLPDTARLELALRRAYHAADATPITPESLQQMPPEALLAAHLTFAPAVQIIRSPWPIHAIWQFNIKDGPKPPAVAQDVLITRPAYDSQMALLGPGAADFIAALQQGETLGAAHEAATTSTPDFDLSELLGQLLAGQAIITINP
jgi:hypothetical protein